MLKIENYEVMGWEHAIRGCRNPMNSWEKSDSAFKCPYYGPETPICSSCHENFCIGPNDLSLMMKLRNAGADHRKFMRMITVYFDMVAPFYIWKEFDTYKVGTVANSCSTMHKLTAKPFEINDFSHDHLKSKTAQNRMQLTVDDLNDRRTLYLNFDAADQAVKDEYDNDPKNVWYEMIQLMPNSYNQRRTIMLNYEVLTNIYHARKNHKLDEWHTFCRWIESLPYSELITGERKEDVE